MTLKSKYIAFIFLIVITFLISTTLYILLDEPPYDDKHLEIKDKVVLHRDNGYDELIRAIGSAVMLHEITEKQSDYIGKMNTDHRLKLYDDVMEHKKVDKRFIQEYLKVGKKSLTLLDEVLSKKKHYQATKKYTWPEVSDTPTKFLVMSKLLLFKANCHLNKGETSKYFEQISRALRLSEIYGSTAKDTIDGMILIVTKSLIINSLIKELASNRLNPNHVHKNLGPLSEYRLKPNHYIRTLKGEYRNMIETLGYLQDGHGKAFNLSNLSITYFTKNNMTRRKYGDYISSHIKAKDDAYSKKLNFKGRNLESILGKYDKNFVGEMMMALSALMLEKRIRNHYIFQTKLSLLETLIPLMRYEKKYHQLPEKLSVLIPEFLESVPIDFFDLLSIKYSKQNRKVWTTGKDILNADGSAMIDDKNAIIKIPAPIPTPNKK